MLAVSATPAIENLQTAIEEWRGLLPWDRTLNFKASGHIVCGLQGGPINEVYVLMNKKGTQVHLVPGGASIQRVITADRNGRFTDVALGFDDAASYNDYNINGPKFGGYLKPSFHNCKRTLPVYFC